MHIVFYTRSSGCAQPKLLSELVHGCGVETVLRPLTLIRTDASFEKKCLHLTWLSSACTSFTIILDVDVDRILEVTAELLGFLLHESILGDDCSRSALIKFYSEERFACFHTFESLLYVDGLLCTGLKVRDATIGLAEGHGPLGRDLVAVSLSAPMRRWRRALLTTLLLSSTSILLPRTTYP